MLNSERLRGFRAGVRVKVARPISWTEKQILGHESTVIEITRPRFFLRIRGPEGWDGNLPDGTILVLPEACELVTTTPAVGS